LADESGELRLGNGNHGGYSFYPRHRDDRARTGKKGRTLRTIILPTFEKLWLGNLETHFSRNPATKKDFVSQSLMRRRASPMNWERFQPARNRCRVQRIWISRCSLPDRSPSFSGISVAWPGC